MKYHRQAENLAVLSSMVGNYATVVNSIAEDKIREETERLYKIYVQVTRAELTNFLRRFEDAYWQRYQPRGSHQAFYNGAPDFPPLDTMWVLKKAQGLEAQGRSSLADSIAKGSTPTFFHGLGSYDIAKSKKAKPLADWFETLGGSALRKQRDLYNALGATQLRISGPLATKKGFKQTSTGFINTKTGKAVTQSKALKSRQLVASDEGLILKVSNARGAHVTRNGQRQKILEMNAQGLVGSQLVITAFTNILSTSGLFKPELAKGGFYRFMERQGRNNIFGKQAVKFARNASLGRDPFYKGLQNLLLFTIPPKVQTQFNKGKK